jgi:hypothetical protein
MWDISKKRFCTRLLCDSIVYEESGRLSYLEKNGAIVRWVEYGVWRGVTSPADEENSLQSAMDISRRFHVDKHHDGTILMAITLGCSVLKELVLAKGEYTGAVAVMARRCTSLERLELHCSELEEGTAVTLIRRNSNLVFQAW